MHIAWRVGRWFKNDTNHFIHKRTHVEDCGEIYKFIRADIDHYQFQYNIFCLIYLGTIPARNKTTESCSCLRVELRLLMPGTMSLLPDACLRWNAQLSTWNFCLSVHSYQPCIKTAKHQRCNSKTLPEYFKVTMVFVCISIPDYPSKKTPQIPRNTALICLQVIGLWSLLC
jgi:hypothetical protein